MRIEPGARVGRLVVKRLHDVLIYPTFAAYIYECECDCGNTTYVRLGNLNCGKTRSCGCLRKETIKENQKKRKIYGKSREVFKG